MIYHNVLIEILPFFTGESKESSLLATSLLRQFPQALLIECMLEKLCATYETDPSKQKELFKGITYCDNNLI